MRDSGNNAGEEPAVRRNVRGVAADPSEAKRVETKFRARAHREDVPNDSADARRCTLKRFNRARVIVRFHFECNRPAVADIDHARVFLAGLHQNIRATCRKFLQLVSRIFIRAMLAPHDREDPELGEIGLAPEDFFDPLEFFRREAVFRHQLRSDFRIGGGGVRHRQRTLTEVKRDTTFARPLPLILICIHGKKTKVKT